MNRAHTRSALVGMVVSAPALLTLLPGDWFDESGKGLNRNVQPPDLPVSVHLLLAVVAGVVLATSLVVLLSPAGRRTVRRCDIAVAGPLVLAGLYTGFTYRVATAAVGGANIGAGLLFMLGVVVVPALLARAGYKAWRVRTAR